MWWRRLRYALLLIALCAIATCPAARRSCIARQRATEADDLLGYLADRVAAQVAATGRMPSTPTGPTPEAGCCDRGGTCAPEAALWAAPGWRELAFSIDGEHRFRYQYAPEPGGLAATLRAEGDVACDGELRVVELRLTVAGGQVHRVWSHRTPVRPPT